MQFWALTVDSFRESLDRKIFWVMLLITFLVVIAMLSVGFKEDRITFLFGMWEYQIEGFSPLSGLGRTQIIGMVIYGILNVVLGRVGILLTIIATGSMFPSTLERGVIDVLIAKPISRSRLFLYKYVAGMVFVAFHAILFVLLTFLVMGLRWNVWVPGYLLSPVLVILLFSYVYCISVLVGTLTRSTVAAILISIGAWMAFAVVHQSPLLFEALPKLKEQRIVYDSVRLVSWIPPKTGDLPYLAAKWAQAGTSAQLIPPNADMSAEDRSLVQELEERELLKSPAYSIGSSLLFEFVIVAFAMWKFSRQDY